MEPSNFMKALIWLSGTIWGTNWTFVWALLPWLVVLITLAIYKSKFGCLSLGWPDCHWSWCTDRKGTQAFIADFSRIGRCMRFVGRGHYVLRPDRPAYSQEISGGRHAKPILGSLLLLSANTLGRVIMAPMELPVGIIFSIIGAPYFIYLLVKNI
jgi:iron complex transport system permease protein